MGNCKDCFHWLRYCMGIDHGSERRPCKKLSFYKSGESGLIKNEDGIGIYVDSHKGTNITLDATETIFIITKKDFSCGFFSKEWRVCPNCGESPVASKASEKPVFGQEATFFCDKCCSEFKISGKVYLDPKKDPLYCAVQKKLGNDPS